jgi:hypothetical protein
MNHTENIAEIIIRHCSEMGGCLFFAAACVKVPRNNPYLFIMPVLSGKSPELY